MRYEYAGWTAITRTREQARDLLRDDEGLIHVFADDLEYGTISAYLEGKIDLDVCQLTYGGDHDDTATVTFYDSLTKTGFMVYDRLSDDRIQADSVESYLRLLINEINEEDSK